jgi:2-oxoglutarate dehydrogenase E2 component (dihydrolipoamide succinyltransferase)
MAIVDVQTPQFSESVSEGTLLTWEKKPGEAVTVDETLVEIETDKVVLEVPAPASGVLAEILKADGSTVVSQELLAKIDTEGKAGVAAPATTASQAASPAAAAPAPAAAAPAGGNKGDVAMPAAAKILAEKGLQATDVAGSGKDGRVTKGDALGAAAKPAAAPLVVPATPAVAKPLPAVSAPVQQNLGDRPEQRVPMTRLRARIAERLLQSQATNAILTTFNEVNMAPVMEMRKKFPGEVREGTRRQARLHELLRQGRGRCTEEVPGAERLGRRQRHRLPRLLRHRHRRRLAARPGRAGTAQRRPDELRRHREEDRRVRPEGQGR